MSSNQTFTTKNSSLWNDRINSFIDFISKADKEMGDLPSALLETFFPKESVSSTFSHIITHSEYKGLVERGVVSKALETSRLDEIYRTLENYCNGNDINNRSHYMEHLVEQCDLFYKENTKESDTDLQFVVVMIFFSFLHLTVLKERNCYQEEIFGRKNPIYTKDLTSYLNAYKSYFVTVCPKWEDWRKEKIRSASHTQDFLPEDSEHEKEERVIRFFEEINAEFLNLYVHTSDLEQFTRRSHYSPTIVPNSKGSRIFGPFGTEDGKLCDDEPGVISAIDINCSTVIDAIKVYYREPTGIREGTQMGNNQNGQVYTIKGLNDECNHITAVDVYYYRYVVCGLRFFFSDGTSTKTFGEEVGKSRRCGSTEKNSNLRLTGIRTAGSLYDNARVIGRIELRFEGDNENPENVTNLNFDSEKRTATLEKRRNRNSMYSLLFPGLSSILPLGITS